jgi:hypothetical protein
VLRFASTLILPLLLGCGPDARPAAPPRGWPRAMIVPQPDDQLSFQVDGREILRYHYGPQTPKPYFYPVIGPAGAPVTRLTHPHDPFTHNHHLSLWIGHQDVGGANFWETRPGAGRIVHDRIVTLEDGDRAALAIRAKWMDAQRNVLLADERTWTLAPRARSGEFTLDLELKLTPGPPGIALGKTSFGMLAVRVARMMGTLDGGGTITNSEGKVNETELMPHRRARWCDDSGPVAPGVVNGIALLDHPGNPNHPAYFHVRGDGWMGASLTQAGAIEIRKEEPLVLRYRLFVHQGGCDPAALEAEWSRWAKP